MALRDNRDDPPRLSPWWVAYLAFTVLFLAAAVFAALTEDGSIVSVIAAVALVGGAASAYVQARRLHGEALRTVGVGLDRGAPRP